MHEETLVPVLARIDEVREETSDIRTFRLVIEGGGAGKNLSFKPGQFCLVSVFGVGEAAFSIASPPAWKEFIEITVKKLGRVTSAMHDLEAGDRVGLRGAYGRGFPFETCFGRSVVFVGGGIGLAPLRSIIWQTLLERHRFRDVTIVYGARSVREIIYKEDLRNWTLHKDTNVVLTVDPGGQDDAWVGEVGLVPDILLKVSPSPDSVLYTCGPQAMLKSVFAIAKDLGFAPNDVIATLEMKMTCGVGICGRCNIGSKYVCRDGPVFSLEEIENLPCEY